jgi:hypothetical protein
MTSSALPPCSTLRRPTHCDLALSACPIPPRAPSDTTPASRIPRRHRPAASPPALLAAAPSPPHQCPPSFPSPPPPILICDLFPHTWSDGLGFWCARLHVAVWMAIGFFIKLIFIPINNIIVGSGWFDSRRFFCASHTSSWSGLYTTSIGICVYPSCNSMDI